MSEYIVESKSRKDLRNLALILRKHLGLDNQLWIPVVELLDVLSEIIEGFSCEIVPDSDLPQGTHAETNIRTGNRNLDKRMLLLNPFEYGHGILLLMPAKTPPQVLCSLLLTK